MFISKLIKGVALAGFLLPAIAMAQSELQPPEPNNTMFVSGGTLTAVTPNAVLSWDLASGNGVLTIEKAGEFSLNFKPMTPPNTHGKILFLTGDYAKFTGCGDALAHAISALTTAAGACAIHGSDSGECSSAIATAQSAVDHAFRCFQAIN